MSDDEASGNDGEVDLFEPQPKRLKLTLNKPEKEKFCWTLKHKTAMAKMVFQKNGHLSYVKDGLKKAQRWQAILLALQKTPLFVDLDISSKSLMNKFAEEVEKVCDNCGVTKQSVNLSGFSNKPPEYESLMLSMAEEAEKQKCKSVRKAKLQKDHKALLTSITANALSGTKNDDSVVLPVSDSTNSARKSTNSRASGLTDDSGTKENEPPPVLNKVESFFGKLEGMLEKLMPAADETAALTQRAMLGQANYYEMMMAKEANRV